MPRTVSLKVLGFNIETHPVVFPVSALLTIGFVVLTALFPTRALIAFDWLQANVSDTCGWLYVLAMSGFLIFAIYLCFSRYGKIRLGEDQERPEFPMLTWFAMLFSAGMGIGMLFFGVAEPMWHYLSPPSGEGETLASARQAMGITLFHWCLHPWSLYALVGLSLAYFGFRKKLPLSFRSVFHPLLGDRIHGRLGDLIDIMAVVATLFGLATSLGLGAKQVNAGLNFIFGLPQGTWIQVMLIAGITAIAVVSLVSGLHVGIRRLSETNMVLAGFLVVFLLIFGPTVYLLSSLVGNIGTYLQYLPANSFRTAAYDGDEMAGWLNSWTIFYWGWWIAWSPFVGMFIARVSRGRTIREFLLGVMLVPSAVAVVWLTVFGNSGLHQEIHAMLNSNPAAEYNSDLNGETANHSREVPSYLVQVIDEQHQLPMTDDREYLVGPHAQAVATPVGVLMKDSNGGLVTKSGRAVEYQGGVLIDSETRAPYRIPAADRFTGRYAAETRQLTLGGFLNSPVLDDGATNQIDTTATAMFVMLQSYPLIWLTALIGTLSIVLFFVTSSDSASMVADIIASGGQANPAVGTRLFWGILEGCLAAVLLVAGGLRALQTGSITIGLPFCLLIILMCYSLHRALRGELREKSAE